MFANKTAGVIGVLALCQAFFMCGQSLNITVVSLAGYQLAPHKALATLPLTLQFVGMMLMTLPASLLMGRVGRRAGFMIGLLLGICGCLLSLFAMLEARFWLFVAGAALYGGSAAFAQLYRFAAAEACAPDFRSRAISLVLAGGVIAAFFGPAAAPWSRDLLLPALFAGSYLVMVGVQFAGMAMLLFLRLPAPAPLPRGDTGRPLAEIMRQPAFLTAMCSAMFGYVCMNLVMTAAPLAMNHNSHALSDTAFVIQWHVLGMFLPSFFTGWLIARFGLLNIIAAGAALGLTAVLAGLSGQAVWNFWLGLFLMGLAWNFMFVGGTTLLTSVHTPGEKAKTQGINDFFVFGAVAVGSLGAGAIFNFLGWQAVMVAVLPMLVAVMAMNVWLRHRQAAPA